EPSLRLNRPVPALARRQAGVAVAAGGGVLPLSEVLEQLRPAAGDRRAEREHGVEVLGGVKAEDRVDVGALDHLALLDHVLQAVRQPGRGRLTVAAGAARFLV